MGYSSAFLGLTFTQTGTVSGSTYSFKLRAQNVHGWSDWSTVTSLLSATVPDKMAMVTVTDGILSTTTIKITFVEPSNLGSPITSYLIQIEGKD